MMAGATDASPKLRRWSSRRSTWNKRFVAALSATGFINVGSVSKSLAAAWLCHWRKLSSSLGSFDHLSA